MYKRATLQKNDNAHVEQKDFTLVRNIFVYEKVEGDVLVSLMNEIYIKYLEPLKNFYIPCLKLKRKTRIGAKIRKVYDRLKTPYQKRLDSDN